MNLMTNHKNGTIWVEVNPVTLDIPQLPEVFDQYKIVQFSDIHMDGRMNKERLGQVVELVNLQKPDLVTITGDFVTHSPDLFSNDLQSSLINLQAKDAAVAILGNHDHWNGADLIRKIIRDSGLIELSNDVITIRRGNSEISIAGVDDHMNESSDLDRVLRQLPKEGTAILLAHEPDFAEISAATCRFALQLSGHSHGGQVNLPIIGSPILPRYARKYPHGLYRVGKMLLYTNRGLGEVHLPFRIRSRPEITVFTLVSGKGN